MKALLGILAACQVMGGIVSATFVDPISNTAAASMSIDTTTRQMSLTVLSPWDSAMVGWQPTTVSPYYYSYWFWVASPPVVAPADMPFDSTLTRLKLWKTVLEDNQWVQYQTDAVGSFNLSIPEPSDLAIGSGVGLLAFAMRRRIKLLLPVLALTTVALAEPVEVVSSTVSLKTRSYLSDAKVTYGFDATGTNVVMTQLILTAQTEKSVGDGAWEKTGTTSTAYTRTDVDRWVTTYVNAQGVTVTNSIKASFVADLTRIELLPTRYVQFSKVPQATVVVVPE